MPASKAISWLELETIIKEFVRANVGDVIHDSGWMSLGSYFISISLQQHDYSDLPPDDAVQVLSYADYITLVF